VHNLVSDGFVTADHMDPVGLVSHKDRPYAATEGLFQDMMQTDALINPDNSGPLIDMPWCGSAQ
jgi:S1-C subfamily serine protease